MNNLEIKNTPSSFAADNLVSVIIPTYNRRNFLEEAIDSVLSQTYNNYELIIIDDGSTDGTKEFVKSKYGNKVSYVWQSNQGRSKARNLGLSLAKGKYIAFLDSDDQWLPQKLTKQIAAFTRKNSNEIAAICSSVYFINEFGEQIHKSSLGRHRHIDKYKLEKFYLSPMILAPPSNMLIRKQCLEEIQGFDENIDFGEDWDLIIRLRNKWKFYFIDEPLLKFRFSSKFLNRLPEVNYIPGMVSDLQRIFDKIESNPEFHAEKKRLLTIRSGIWEKAAYWYFANGEYYSAIKILTTNNYFEIFKNSRFFNKLGYWGSYSAISKFGYNPLLCEKYFFTEYLPGVTNSLKNVIVIKKTEINLLLSSYYHNLAWHLYPKITGKIIFTFCLKAVYFNQLYLMSLQTWKLICISLISWITNGHKNEYNS